MRDEGRIVSCRICGSSKLDLVIDLGMQPWGNHFLRPADAGKEPLYPLHVMFCRECCAAQLDYTVPKETMFGDHTYLSGTSRSLDDHFRNTAEVVDSTFFRQKKSKSILDIGSNDGTQLRHYQHLGYDVLGVEPSRTTAKLAMDKGVPTLNDYFNAEAARKIGRKFDVINASGVFFHLEELHSVTKGIRDSLAEEGVFVVQFLYMKKIIENCAFDQIYHEHLLFYTLATLSRLLEQHDLELFDANLAPIHGGSIIGFVGHKGNRKPSGRLAKLLAEEEKSGVNKIETYPAFVKRIQQKKSDNVSFLNGAKAEGKRVYGMGAPVKGNTLLNYFGINKDLISCLVEVNPLRKGLIAPGSHIPIVLEADVASQPPDIYYVLAWNFKNDILKKHAELVSRGVRFYFPVEAD